MFSFNVGSFWKGFPPTNTTLKEWGFGLFDQTWGTQQPSLSFYLTQVGWITPITQSRNHGKKHAFYCWRDPFFTSMSMKGQKIFCLKNLQTHFVFRHDIFLQPILIHLEFVSQIGKKNTTPSKFNIAPEKWWLEDEFPFGSKPMFRGYVKFSGCKNHWTENYQTITSWWFQPIWKILVKLGIFPK